jgi:hypothetical protein
MKHFSSATVRTVVILVVFTLLVGAVSFLPEQFSSNAENQAAPAETSHERGLPNFDIRTDKSEQARESLIAYRGTVGKDASFVADLRDRIVRGENAIRSRMPDVVVEYNDRVGAAEVISPDVWKENAGLLTPPNRLDKRPDALKSFLRENADLVGLDPVQTDALKTAADYTNPEGNLSYTHLEQEIDGIPVFAGEVKAGFDRQGQIVRVINNLAPGLEYSSLAKNFGDPADAVRAAAGYMEVDLEDGLLQPDAKESTDLTTVFGRGDFATTAEKMYFPTEPGVAVPAWRVLIWQPVDTYYVIVDAANGNMLWRKNITEDQSQAATYDVYRNANAYIDVADSPAPFTPGPNAPDGSQSPVISRQNLTLIGNEGDLAFNNLGWINDNTNITDGNSNQAGIDRDGINGVDAAQVGSPTRVFTSTWNPPPGNPAPGDGPLTSQAQRGAVIQMFYVMNRYHDEMYKRGFTEAARNFQHNNFGRGGLGSDRISSEGQDSSGTNNANFSTPSDGSRGRMQMYIWTGPNPDRDGTADADIIIHEVTHGTSNRLHGNATGLSTNMSRGMGEGWSDFYAHAMLAEPTDPINGIYTIGGYSTLLATSSFTSNYYYGIRRFPKAVIAFTGPNGKPHNPQTFRYVNNNCNTLIGSTTSNPPPNSAYPRGPFGSSTCDQVHNLGEIWSSALWEVRALMVQRLGFTAGTARVLQVVTDGMKLAPTGPTFLQERDAILLAASSFSPEDVADVREGFRRRGMGFSASIQNAGTGSNNTSVTEAYDMWPGDPTPTPTPTPTPEPTPTPTPTPTPEPTPTPAPGFSLSVVTRKVQGVLVADLTWSGASGANVDYYRNSTVFSTPNDGSHTDNTGLKGKATITYRVCETGSTTTCSNSVTATW